jgi:hypothetical protein
MDKTIPGTIQPVSCVLYLMLIEKSVVEFSSRAIPQPFLDPSVIQRRIQAEAQWKREQEILSKQAD